MKKFVQFATVMTLLSTASITALADVSNGDKGGEKTSNGLVEFFPSSSITDPKDPEDPNGKPDPENPETPWDPKDPENKPEPGTKGPLSIDFASNLNFGENKITNEDETYFARAQNFYDKEGKVTKVRPNYVQISDNRGTNAGWTLTVRQEGQFKAEKKTLNSELKNAVITLKAPNVQSNSNATKPEAEKEIVLNPSKVESPVMSAANEAGAGTWTNAWGTVEEVTEMNKKGEEVKANVTKEVTLDVPGSTSKDAVKYATKLTWILSDQPGNAEA